MKRLMTRTATVLGLCGVLLLGACAAPTSQQDDASTVARKMHAAITSQNWDAAMPLYGETFLAAHDKATWQAKLASLQERFGKLKDVKAVFDQRSPRLGGVFYIYGYKLVFERGVVSETLNMFGDDQDKITVSDQIFKFKDDVL